MKTMPTATKLMAVAAVFIGLLASHASAQTQTNPIPGIDVVVHKKPTGNGIKATTDKEGRFSFEGLKAGDYTIGVVVPPKLAERYEGWYGGVGVVDLGYRANITLGKGPSKPIPFTIAKDGQKLTGTVAASGESHGLLLPAVQK